MKIIRNVEDANLGANHFYYGSRYNIMEVRETKFYQKDKDTKVIFSLAVPGAPFQGIRVPEAADLFDLSRHEQKATGIAYTKHAMIEWLLEKSANSFDLVLEFDTLLAANLFAAMLSIEPYNDLDIDLLEASKDFQAHEQAFLMLLGQLDHFQEMLDSIKSGIRI